MVAAIKGYRAVFCMPDKVSSEKVEPAQGLRRRGLAEPDRGRARFARSQLLLVAKRIASERPGALLMNQYHNPANPEAHYRTTGPELWKQTAGKITHFVAGMGTGGTISGVARYLKEKNQNVQVDRRRSGGLDPQALSTRRARSSGGRTPTRSRAWARTSSPAPPISRWWIRVISCNDRDGLNTARRLAREEALFTGGSGGMAAWVALQVAQGAAGRIAGGGDAARHRRALSLSKVHNDAWMRDNHLLDPSAASVARAGRRQDAHDAARCCRCRSGEPLQQRALALVEQHNVTQVPVLRGREVVGTLYDSDILQARHSTTPRRSSKPVES